MSHTVHLIIRIHFQKLSQTKKLRKEKENKNKELEIWYDCQENQRNVI